MILEEHWGSATVVSGRRTDGKHFSAGGDGIFGVRWRVGPGAVEGGTYFEHLAGFGLSWDWGWSGAG